ncbi:MAG: biopolymer transporter ExbD [Myxococcales bacterium]|nr:biopolymer transporter ExbD [Myxococcales bacterium]
MAGVDVGGSSQKRSVSAEINMIPFIDLLFMMLAFLLVTAVWTSNSRIQANANVPDDPTKPVDPTPEEKMLHVYVGENDFTLAWKQGATVLSEVKVEKDRADGDRAAYPTLAKRVQAEWAQHGLHKDPADAKLDNVVLHTDNRAPYKEIAAVMDAVHATKREVAAGAKVASVPAMNLTFSVK